MRFEPYALEWIERYTGRNGSLRERTREARNAQPGTPVLVRR